MTFKLDLTTGAALTLLLVATGCTSAVNESAADIREFFQALGVPLKENQP